MHCMGEHLGMVIRGSVLLVLLKGRRVLVVYNGRIVACRNVPDVIVFMEIRIILLTVILGNNHRRNFGVGDLGHFSFDFASMVFSEHSFFLFAFGKVIVKGGRPRVFFRPVLFLLTFLLNLTILCYKVIPKILIILVI